MKKSNFTYLAGVSCGALILSFAGPVLAETTMKPASATKDVTKDQMADDSGTMERADADMKKVLTALAGLHGKPIEKLMAAEARKQPTPTDAVMVVLKEDGKDPAKLKAEMGVTTQDVSYPAGKGNQKARIYIPAENDKAKLDGGTPIIVYYHGGGFVIADINVYDAGPRALAKKTGAIVVSAEYRHAPENKFPAAHEDAFAAYQWAIKNAVSWGGNPMNVAVAGESAGGNLAANVAIMARDKKVQAPVHMLLVYPVAGNDMNTQSYQENEKAKPLNKAMMAWFVKNIITKDSDKNDPRINLIAANLSGLPSSTIIGAEIDPLTTEGKTLADKLTEAGNTVDYKLYSGVTHEFFGMDAVVDAAADAQDFAADDLKASFEKHQKSE